MRLPLMRCFVVVVMAAAAAGGVGGASENNRFGGEGSCGTKQANRAGEAKEGFVEFLICGHIVEASATVLHAGIKELWLVGWLAKVVFFQGVGCSEWKGQTMSER